MPLHRLEEQTLGVEEENLQLTEYEKEQYLKVLHSSAIPAEPQTPNWQPPNNDGHPSATTVRTAEYWNEITASPYPCLSSTFSSEEEDWQHVIPSHHPAKNKEQLATWRQDSKLPEQNKEQLTTWRQDSKLPEQNKEQLTTWRQDSKLPEQNKEQLTTWRQDSKLPEQNKEQLTTWRQDSKLPEQNREQLSTWWQDSKLTEEDASIEEKRISSGFTSKGESWAAVSTRPHPNSLSAEAEEPGPLPGNGHQSGGQTGGNSGQSWPLSPRGPPSTAGWPAGGPANQVPATQPPPEPPLANQLRHLAASALPFTQVRNCSVKYLNLYSLNLLPFFYH
jgi:cation transport regulator ChaB